MLAPGVTLYFVRHGETDWNVAQRYQGRRDIPLNTNGRAQAKRNGHVLAEMLGESAGSLDYVASPLHRARETMEIMRRELGLAQAEYRIDARLSEIDYGHWEGHLWNELPTIDPEGFAARKANIWEWQPRGGESYRMLSERVATWLAEIGRDTVVASHGGVSRTLRGLILRLEPAAIFTLEVPQDKILRANGNGVRWL